MDHRGFFHRFHHILGVPSGWIVSHTSYQYVYIRVWTSAEWIPHLPLLNLLEFDPHIKDGYQGACHGACHGAQACNQWDQHPHHGSTPITLRLWNFFIRNLAHVSHRSRRSPHSWMTVRSQPASMSAAI